MMETKLNEVKNIYKADDIIPEIVTGDNFPKLLLDKCYVDLQLINNENFDAFYLQRYFEATDFFQKEATDVVSQNILILGPSGMGKTTLLKRLIQNWANGKIHSQRFKCVFYLPLSFMLLQEFKVDITSHRLSSQEKVVQFISLLLLKECPQSQQKKKLKQGLKSFIQNAIKSKHTLLLVDEFNEIVSAMKKSDDYVTQIVKQLARISKECSMVMTSRPVALQAINRIQFKFSKVLRNVGINNESIHTYIESFFDQDSQSQTKEMFKTTLFNNSLIREIAQIPMNLTMMCIIAKQEKSNIFKNQLNETVIFQNLFLLVSKRYLENIGKPNSSINTQNMIEKCCPLRILSALAFKKFKKNQELQFSRQEMIKFFTDDEKKNQEKVFNEVKSFGVLKIKSQRFYEFQHAGYIQFLSALQLTRRIRSEALDDLQNGKQKSFQTIKGISKFRCQSHYRKIFKMTASMLASLQPHNEQYWQLQQIFWHLLIDFQDGINQLAQEGHLGHVMSHLSDVPEKYRTKINGKVKIVQAFSSQIEEIAQDFQKMINQNFIAQVMDSQCCFLNIKIENLLIKYTVQQKNFLQNAQPTQFKSILNILVNFSHKINNSSMVRIFSYLLENLNNYDDQKKKQILATLAKVLTQINEKTFQELKQQIKKFVLRIEKQTQGIEHMKYVDSVVSIIFIVISKQEITKTSDNSGQQSCLRKSLKTQILAKLQKIYIALNKHLDVADNDKNIKEPVQENPQKIPIQNLQILDYVNSLFRTKAFDFAQDFAFCNSIIEQKVLPLLERVQTYLNSIYSKSNNNNINNKNTQEAQQVNYKLLRLVIQASRIVKKILKKQKLQQTVDDNKTIITVKGIGKKLLDYSLKRLQLIIEKSSETNQQLQPQPQRQIILLTKICCKLSSQLQNIVQRKYILKVLKILIIVHEKIKIQNTNVLQNFLAQFTKVNSQHKMALLLQALSQQNIVTSDEKLLMKLFKELFITNFNKLVNLKNKKQFIQILIKWSEKAKQNNDKQLKQTIINTLIIILYKLRKSDNQMLVVVVDNNDNFQSNQQLKNITLEGLKKTLPNFIKLTIFQQIQQNNSSEMTKQTEQRQHQIKGLSKEQIFEVLKVYRQNYQNDSQLSNRMNQEMARFLSMFKLKQKGLDTKKKRTFYQDNEQCIKEALQIYALTFQFCYNSSSNFEVEESFYYSQSSLITSVQSQIVYSKSSQNTEKTNKIEAFFMNIEPYLKSEYYSERKCTLQILKRMAMKRFSFRQFFLEKFKHAISSNVEIFYELSCFEYLLWDWKKNPSNKQLKIIIQKNVKKMIEKYNPLYEKKINEFIRVQLDESGKQGNIRQRRVRLRRSDGIIITLLTMLKQKQIDKSYIPIFFQFLINLVTEHAIQIDQQSIQAIKEIIQQPIKIGDSSISSYQNAKIKGVLLLSCIFIQHKKLSVGEYILQNMVKLFKCQTSKHINANHIKQNILEFFMFIEKSHNYPSSQTHSIDTILNRNFLTQILNECNTIIDTKSLRDTIPHVLIFRTILMENPRNLINNYLTLQKHQGFSRLKDKELIRSFQRMQNYINQNMNGSDDSCRKTFGEVVCFVNKISKYLIFINKIILDDCQKENNVNGLNKQTKITFKQILNFLFEQNRSCLDERTNNAKFHGPFALYFIVRLAKFIDDSGGPSQQNYCSYFIQLFEEHLNNSSKVSEQNRYCDKLISFFTEISHKFSQRQSIWQLYGSSKEIAANNYLRHLECDKQQKLFSKLVLGKNVCTQYVNSQNVENVLKRAFSRNDRKNKSAQTQDLSGILSLIDRFPELQKNYFSQVLAEQKLIKYAQEIMKDQNKLNLINCQIIHNFMDDSSLSHSIFVEKNDWKIRETLRKYNKHFCENMSSDIIIQQQIEEFEEITQIRKSLSNEKRFKILSKIQFEEKKLSMLSKIKLKLSSKTCQYLLHIICDKILSKQQSISFQKLYFVLNCVRAGLDVSIKRDHSVKIKSKVYLMENQQHWQMLLNTIQALVRINKDKVQGNLKYLQNLNFDYNVYGITIPACRVQPVPSLLNSAFKVTKQNIVLSLISIQRSSTKNIQKLITIQKRNIIGDYQIHKFNLSQQGQYSHLLCHPLDLNENSRFRLQVFRDFDKDQNGELIDQTWKIKTKYIEFEFDKQFCIKLLSSKQNKQQISAFRLWQNSLASLIETVHKSDILTSSVKLINRKKYQLLGLSADSNEATYLQVKKLKETLINEIQFSQNKRNLQEYRCSEPKKFIYYQIFFWTLLGQFESMRLIKSGNFKSNSRNGASVLAGKFEDLAQKGVYEGLRRIFQWGSQKQNSSSVIGVIVDAIGIIPGIGSGMAFLNKQINSIFDSYYDTAFESKKTKLNNLIMQNNFYRTSDIENMIQNLAMKMIQHRQNMLVEAKNKEDSTPTPISKQQTSSSPPIHTLIINGVINAVNMYEKMKSIASDWIKQKAFGIQHIDAFGKDNDIAALALKDVCQVLLICFEKHKQISEKLRGVVIEEEVTDTAAHNIFSNNSQTITLTTFQQVLLGYIKKQQQEAQQQPQQQYSQSTTQLTQKPATKTTIPKPTPIPTTITKSDNKCFQGCCQFY